MSIPFSGNPKVYRRHAFILSGAVHLWLYLFFVVTKFLAQDENWLTVWQLPAGLAASAVLVGWLHFRWVMRLDAQYGRGSGWEMKEVTVKLPVLRPRKRPAR